MPLRLEMVPDALKTGSPVSGGVNGDLLALLVLVFEFHNAVDQGEDREVFSKTYVFTRVELGSPLTTDDLSAFYSLSAVDLDSEHLRIAIATVFCTTTGFFMCHDFTPMDRLLGADEQPAGGISPRRRALDCLK